MSQKDTKSLDNTLAQLLFEGFFQVFHQKLDESDYVVQQPYIFWRKNPVSFSLIKTQESETRVNNIKDIFDFDADWYENLNIDNEKYNQVLQQIHTLLSQYRSKDRVELSIEVNLSFPFTSELLIFFTKFINKSENLFEIFSKESRQTDIYHFLKIVVSSREGKYFYSFSPYDSNFNYNEGAETYEHMIEKSLEVNPESFFIQAVAAVNFSDKGEKKGLTHFQKVLTLDPNNLHIIANFARYLGSSYYSQTRDKGYLEKALTLIKKAQELDTQKKYIWVDAWMGEIYRKLGKLEEALASLDAGYKRMEAKGAFFYLPVLWLGKIYAQKGEYSTALEYLEKAKQMIPETEYYHFYIHRYLSLAYAFVGKKKESQDELIYFLYRNIKKRTLKFSLGEDNFVISFTEGLYTKKEDFIISIQDFQQGYVKEDKTLFFPKIGLLLTSDKTIEIPPQSIDKCSLLETIKSYISQIDIQGNMDSYGKQDIKKILGVLSE